jgi:hypothetical protein
LRFPGQGSRSHGADHSEAIARFADVQVGQQDIEFLFADQVQRFGNVGGGGQLEAVKL